MESRPVESRGFQNLGVHCYANSAIQLLFHSPIFKRWLGKQSSSHRVECQKKERSCTLCQLIELYRDYFSGPTQKPLSVFSLLAAMQQSCWSKLHINEPQCLFEFLDILMRHLQEEYHLQDLQQELFDRKTCLACDAVSTSVSRGPENCIRIAMKSFASLSEAIHSKLEATFEATHPSTCFRCSRVAPHRNDERFVQVPNVLVVTIENNFTPYTGYQRSRIQNRLTLDYISPEGIEIGCKPYVLKGLVYHVNADMMKVDRYGGHYISVCKEPDNNFYEFDDSKVTTVTDVESISFSAPAMALYEIVHAQESQQIEYATCDPVHIPVLVDSAYKSTLEQMKTEASCYPINPVPLAVEERRMENMNIVSIKHNTTTSSNPCPPSAPIMLYGNNVEINQVTEQDGVEMELGLEADQPNDIDTNVVTLPANSILVFDVGEGITSGTRNAIEDGQSKSKPGLTCNANRNMDFAPPINDEICDYSPTKSDIMEVMLHSLLHLKSFREQCLINKEKHLQDCRKIKCKMCWLLKDVTRFTIQLDKKVPEVRIPLNVLATALYEMFEDLNAFGSLTANTAALWLINHISNCLDFVKPLFSMTYIEKAACSQCQQIDIGNVIEARAINFNLHKDECFDLQSSILEDKRQQFCYICKADTQHTIRKEFGNFPTILAISVYAQNIHVDIKNIIIQQTLILPSRDGITTSRYKQNAWIYEDKPSASITIFSNSKYYALCTEEGSLYKCDGENRIKIYGGESNYDELPIFLLYEMEEHEIREKPDADVIEAMDLETETDHEYEGVEPPISLTLASTVADQVVVYAKKKAKQTLIPNQEIASISEDNGVLKEKMNNSITGNKESTTLTESQIKKPNAAKKKKQGLRNKQCSKCTKRFFHKKDLYHHLIKDHGTEEEQKLVKSRNICKTCQRGFYTRDRLQKHYKDVHQKKFKCTVCDFTAARKTTLTGHTRKMHLTKEERKALKTIKCGKCNFQTFDQQKLRAHMNRKHHRK